MKIYLAAAYSRREEMQTIAEQLHAMKHTIIARWIDGRHQTPPAGIVLDSPAHLAWAAAEDLEDIRACECLVSVTGGEQLARGGRHAEFGYGIALGKKMIILGEREHVFHFLPQVSYASSLTALMLLLSGNEREVR